MKRKTSMLLLVFCAFALAFGVQGCCSAAVADEVRFDEGSTPIELRSPIDLGLAELVIHGKGHFTIDFGTVEAETYGDPIVAIDGVMIGHWPSKVVTYILPDGVELTCEARGPKCDTNRITIWKPRTDETIVIEDVDTLEPRYERHLVGSTGALRERGDVLTWTGTTWNVGAGRSLLPLDEDADEILQVAAVPLLELARGRD